jgi:hypothetical protein
MDYYKLPVSIFRRLTALRNVCLQFLCAINVSFFNDYCINFISNEHDIFFFQLHV